MLFRCTWLLLALGSGPGPEPVRLSVRVFDGAVDEAAERVEVLAVPSFGAHEAELAHEVTDAEGRATFALVPGVRYSLFVDGRERGLSATWRPVDRLLAGEERLLDVRLAPLVERAGRVVTESGAPVAGARVHTLRTVLVPGRADPLPHAETRTDEQGRFVLRAGANDRVAWVTAEGHAPRLFELASATDELALTIEHDVTLRGRVVQPRRVAFSGYRIEVRVSYAELFAAAGGPAAEALAVVGSLDLGRSATCAPDGSFEIRGLPREVPAHAIVERSGEPLVRVLVRTGAAPLLVHVPPDVRVHGTLTLAPERSPAGSELVFSRRKTFEHPWDETRRVTTDARGGFSIEAFPAGAWNVYLTGCGSDGGPCVTPRSVTIDPDPPEQRVELVGRVPTPFPYGVIAKLLRGSLILLLVLPGAAVLLALRVRAQQRRRERRAA